MPYRPWEESAPESEPEHTRWVTGERAEKDEDEIQSEFDFLMHEFMELSCERKVFLATNHVKLTKDSGSSGARIPTDARSNMTCIVV